MKITSIAKLVAFLAITHAGFAYSDEYKDLVSARDECNSYGDYLVENQGAKLADVGESPVDIRNTVKYYCIKGFESASTAKSPKEIEQWRTASMRSLSGIVFEIDNYKIQVINTVYKKALAFYNAQHAAPAPAPAPAPEKNHDSASSKIINKLDDFDQEQTHLVTDIKNKIVFIRTYNSPLTEGCEVREKMMNITNIVFDSDDRYPEKMSFSDMKSFKTTIPTNFSSLDNASRSWTNNLFSKGDWVLVQYSICGSGGYVQNMYSISKKTGEVPKAGVKINAN